jgi:protein gp37
MWKKMAEKSGISWTDSTFNPWIGCTKISPGCENCYAAVSTPSRTMKIMWGTGEQRRRTSESNWNLPVRWNAAHAKFLAAHGHRQRVFCASLSDVFDNEVPDAWRKDLWALIEATPHLDWLLLTKRIGLVPAWVAANGAPANVWLGISVVNQAEADRDIPKLQRVSAHVRWLSMEPLLEPVTLPTGTKVDWVVVGGESGSSARPFSASWAEALREQSAGIGAAFFFKQHGGSDKAKGGCSMDGREYKSWPEQVEA